MKKAWKEFEELAHDIQKDLAGGAEVLLDQKLPGYNSKTQRQIDICIRQSVGQFPLLIAMECKDHKVPVDVNLVGEFATKLTDIRANKGAMVSRLGFTQGAIDMAKSYSIDTFQLIDTQRITWRSFVSIPVLLVWTSLDRTSLVLRDFRSLPASLIDGDWRLLEVRDEKGVSLGSINDLIARHWEDGQIPRETGTHGIELARNAVLCAAEIRATATVGVKVVVEKQLWLGNLPIDVKGFRDEQTGEILTREFTTSELAPGRIVGGEDPSWKQIDSLPLAIRPVLTFHCSNAIATLEESSAPPPSGEPS